ncbi:hypothetical protein P3339_13550 [Microbulbifer sp. MLAF003]|uniref:hypothetical protein n=1 Tax=Microbulbifer sp. MLAF003 TaxID=3032582 RepID=UPI0024ACC1E1|nr:hypothetical protein [Microbulbifer sp. MLAF003]WHI49496.1 hypothetical protein P3339_13550 [Microbulbifer sp. MLAF003]
MASQELYQVVSTGRTLHAKDSDQVVRDATKLFSIPEAQARRFLLKGWVIRDQLESARALEYRAGLHKIGLRVEVCPAGKFDNQQLIARIKVAQRRKAQTAKGRSFNKNSIIGSGPGVPPEYSQSPKAAVQSEGSRTLEPSKGIEQIISDKKVTVPSGVGRALLGFLPAIVLPAIFLTVAGLCLYGAGFAFWQIPLAVWQGDLNGSVIVSSLIAIAVCGFLFLLLAAPYLWFPRSAWAKLGEIPLDRAQGKDLLRLFEQLSRRTSLPKVNEIVLSPNAQIFSSPTLSEVIRQQLPLHLGLASVTALRGSEALALVGRGIGIYQGKLTGLLAWLVLDGLRRLELVQWALENERSVLCTSGEPSIFQKPFHRMLVICGHFLLPLVERLENLHRFITRSSARYLESRADLWAADLIGSQVFPGFAERWHRLVHADLIVSETAREAAALGQRFENIPTAIAWTFENLDQETCKAIELAMGQASDPWDVCEAADLERIEVVSRRDLGSRIKWEVSMPELFANFTELAMACTASSAGADCQVVENRRLLCSSREVDEAVQTLEEYFNRLPPFSLLPLSRPASKEMQEMDLQAIVDWLRGKLVDLGEVRERSRMLRARMATMQLGAAMIRNKLRIDPQDYSLKSGSLASAQELAALKRSELEESEKQLQHIYTAFYQRLCLALVTMPAKERQEARNQLRHLSAYDSLEPHLERLAGFSTSLGLFARHLSQNLSERELVQKYLALSARELDATFATVESSELLRSQGLGRALCIKAKRETLQVLPQQHQEALAAVRSMESRCKYARSVILEYYQVQLAALLRRCLERERQLQLSPLRLLRTV